MQGLMRSIVFEGRSDFKHMSSVRRWCTSHLRSGEGQTLSQKGFAETVNEWFLSRRDIHRMQHDYSSHNACCTVLSCSMYKESLTSVTLPRSAMAQLHICLKESTDGTPCCRLLAVADLRLCSQSSHLPLLSRSKMGGSMGALLQNPTPSPSPPSTPNCDPPPHLRP